MFVKTICLLQNISKGVFQIKKMGKNKKKIQKNVKKILKKIGKKNWTKFEKAGFFRFFKKCLHSTTIS